MNNYATLRHAKPKTRGNIAGSPAHCSRERKTPNANPELTPSNIHLLAQPKAEAMKKSEPLLPSKTRKNAALATEHATSASHEFFKDANSDKIKDSTRRCHKRPAAKHGHNNTLNFSAHTDEKTPHAPAYVVPTTPDGRLRARDFVGGRKKPPEAQDTFAEIMKPTGLKRGIRGSKAKHTSIKEFHRGIECDKIETSKENALQIAQQPTTSRTERKKAQEHRDNSDPVHDEPVTVEKELINEPSDNDTAQLTPLADNMRRNNHALSSELEKEEFEQQPRQEHEQKLEQEGLENEQH